MTYIPHIQTGAWSGTPSDSLQGSWRFWLGNNQSQIFPEVGKPLGSHSSALPQPTRRFPYSQWKIFSFLPETLTDNTWLAWGYQQLLITLTPQLFYRWKPVGWACLYPKPVLNPWGNRGHQGDGTSSTLHSGASNSQKQAGNPTRLAWILLLSIIPCRGLSACPE